MSKGALSLFSNTLKQPKLATRSTKEALESGEKKLETSRQFEGVNGEHNANKVYKNYKNLR